MIFLSPSFTNYQREAINFKDLPIELWEIKRYNNDTVTFNQIQTSGAKESVKTISGKDETAKRVNKEIKVYTEDEHLKIASPEILELYENFKASILNFEGVEIKPKKKYLAFISGSNISDIHVQRKSLKLWINLSKGNLDDPKKITRDVSNIGHWGNGDYEIQVKNDDDLEYIISLIKQSYRKNRR